jgi:hypothetical protein
VRGGVVEGLSFHRRFEGFLVKVLQGQEMVKTCPYSESLEGTTDPVGGPNQRFLPRLVAAAKCVGANNKDRPNAR